MTEAKISSKNQIVIPREAREALGVKAGDKIRVSVIGNKVLMMEKSKPAHAALKGLGRGTYPSGYLEKERKSWDRGA
jgi:AbrB family looped-hinge helix DNA binding protein